MINIYFNKIVLSKPNRYVLLLKHQNQIKRSQISNLWTSSPQFAPIAISSPSTFQIKLCEASADKKIKILGTAKIEESQLDIGNQILYEGQKKIENQIEGKMVCVGLIHIQVSIKQQQEVFQESINKEGQVGVQEEDYQLEQQKIQENNIEESDDYIRVQIHCGFNFYLGSGFYVGVEWSGNSFQTRSIKDKINPVWAEGCRLQGLDNKPISVKIQDSKNNLLETFQFNLVNLRTLFPYHIRLIFKEQYMGALPEIYLSIIRQSTARHSIIELPLTFGLKNIGQSPRNGMFMMISLVPNPQPPLFFTLDRGKYSTVQHINGYLTKRTLGQQQRIDLIGLSNKNEKLFSVFKTYLNRKIYLYLIAINDFKQWFSAQNSQGSKILQSKIDFQAVLRKVYYHGQMFTIKKLVQFYNPNTIEESRPQQQSFKERWRLMTGNYILRNKIVNNSMLHIAQLKQAISERGNQLVELKKILKKVKQVNFGLVGKQKITSIIKSRAKGKLFAKEIDTSMLISSLFQKQAILEGQKRINSQLSLRMDSLSQIQENHQDLDEILKKNAKEIKQQEKKILKLGEMEQSIKRQRLIIGELQKMFERSEVDRLMNKALRQQTEKLSSIQQKKNNALKNVYRIIKDNNEAGGNLTVKVKHAEETLIKLNQHYARLTAL